MSDLLIPLFPLSMYFQLFKRFQLSIIGLASKFKLFQIRPFLESRRARGSEFLQALDSGLVGLATRRVSMSELQGGPCPRCVATTDLQAQPDHALSSENTPWTRTAHSRHDSGGQGADQPL